MGWEGTRDAVMAESAALADLVAGLDDPAWSRPTACDGWSTGQLVAHVASAMTAQQQAFQNLLAGSTETPPYDGGTHDSIAATRAALEASTSAVAATQPRLTVEHEDQLAPLPFGTFPLPLALQIVLLEYGTHRWDLAVVDDPAAELTPATAACVLDLLPGFLTMYAVAPPTDAALAYRFDAGAHRVDVSTRGDGWVLEPATDAHPATATATVSGSPSAVALFTLGRIAADDPRLAVDGAHAADFKAWFPGP